MNQKFDWKSALIALGITLGIFLTVVVLSRYITSQKLASVRDAQDSVAIDIMSSETEFSLLSELSCKSLGTSTLTQELNDMAAKIDYSENNIGTNTADVIKLKDYYTLLEIKDSLLMKKISEQCGKKITSILYVYTTAANCSECANQGYVLTALREKYPDLRVYSFDYNLDLSALHALLSIYNIKDTALPAIIVDGQVYTGFHALPDIEKLIPGVVKAQQDKEKAAATPVKASGTAGASATGN
jgi:hypothetical protein